MISRMSHRYVQRHRVAPCYEPIDWAIHGVVDSTLIDGRRAMPEQVDDEEKQALRCA